MSKFKIGDRVRCAGEVTGLDSRNTYRITGYWSNAPGCLRLDGVKGVWADHLFELAETTQPTFTEEKEAEKVDYVDHPKHYTAGAVECWDAIRAALGDEAFIQFCRGTVIKYLWRAGKKGEAKEDYRKAVAYLTKLLSVENAK